MFGRPVSADTAPSRADAVAALVSKGVASDVGWATAQMWGGKRQQGAVAGQ